MSTPKMHACPVLLRENETTGAGARGDGSDDCTLHARAGFITGRPAAGSQHLEAGFTTSLSSEGADVNVADACMHCPVRDNESAGESARGLKRSRDLSLGLVAALGARRWVRDGNGRPVGLSAVRLKRR